MHELAPGAEIAGYRIERIVGYGGMGRVYLATQLDLGRQVALKLIAPEYADDGRFRERFKQESRLAASIDHPNVIPVYEARDVDGFLFLSMRYVDGPDLRHLVKSEGPLEPGRGAAIVAQVASALDAAHKRGLVHRDVKPGNVLIAEGEPEHAYLTDFGLVKSTEGGADLTASGQFVGTLDYTAPEQIQASRPDARTDVYALGGVLFYALTGRVPFERETDAAKIYAHLNAPPPRPSELIGDLPDGLDQVVERAMAKDPAERFPAAGDLGRATRAATERRAPSQPEQSVATGEAAPTVGGEPTLAERDATTTPRPPPARRRTWPALAAGIAIAGIAAVVFLVAAAGDDETRAALSPDGYFDAGGRVKQLDAFETELLVTRQASDGEELAQQLPDGKVQALGIRPADDFAGADLGPGGPNQYSAVYSRCKGRFCDVKRSVFGKADEVPVEGADRSACSEAGPAVEGRLVAFGIRPPSDPECGPGLYLKAADSERPTLIDQQWAGGTELNDGELGWVVGNSVRVLRMADSETVTAIHPDGHEFQQPLAIEGGRIYFIDLELPHGHTTRRYYIARADATRPSAVARYGEERAVPFKAPPSFAVADGGKTLYFSGETDEDPRSGLETITLDEDPQFSRWTSIQVRQR